MNLSFCILVNLVLALKDNLSLWKLKSSRILQLTIDINYSRNISIFLSVPSLLPELFKKFKVRSAIELLKECLAVSMNILIRQFFASDPLNLIIVYKISRLCYH